MRRSSRVVSSATIAAAAAVAAGAAMVALPAATARGAEADFKIVDHSVAVDLQKQTATFTLVFDERPDFVAGDMGQPMAFQYEIDAHDTSLNTPLTFNDIDTVVRGTEIGRGQGLPVRDRDGDGGGPEAGGWGPVRALLPFELTDNTLTFTAGLSALGDTDGKFRYRVLTTENGSVTSEAQGAVIPLPAASLTGVGMLTALGVARVVRMRKNANR